MRRRFRKDVKSVLDYYGINETLEKLTDELEFALNVMNDTMDDVVKVYDTVITAYDDMIDSCTRMDGLEERIRKIETAEEEKTEDSAADDACDRIPAEKMRPDGMVQEYPPIAATSGAHADREAPMNVTREQISLALDSILGEYMSKGLAEDLHEHIMMKLTSIENRNKAAG